MSLSKRQVILVGVLALTCIAGGVNLYQQYEEGKRVAAASEAAAKEYMERMERMAAEKLAKEQVESAWPKPDRSIDQAVLKALPRTVSAWKQKEKLFYQNLLAAEQFDVLVVPFQLQEYGFSRSIRSLMTAQLALAVSSNANLRVPDSYVLSRALGDGERRLDRQEIYALADRLGVKKIIWGYVGHRRDYKIVLSIQQQSRSANGVLDANSPVVGKNFDGIPFSVTQSPLDAYGAALPEVLSAIDFGGMEQARQQSALDIASVQLPASPMAMTKEASEPLRSSLFFQLLAAMTPTGEERARERFAEKSLLALEGVSPDSPGYPLLKARGLWFLGMPPAALQVLGEPSTPEAMELVAAIKGNLPDLERATTRIKPGVLRLIAELDAHALRTSYQGLTNRGKSIAMAAVSKLPGKIWPYFAGRAFADIDEWAQFENASVKKLLDYEIPIKGFTLEDVARQAAADRDSSNYRIVLDYASRTHVRTTLEQSGSVFRSRTPSVSPAISDYLDLVLAISDDNMLRQPSFLTHVQGLPKIALEYLQRLDFVYDGHPRLTLSAANAQLALTRQSVPAEAKGLFKAAMQNLFDTRYWEQGQTKLSASATEIYWNTSGEAAKAGAVLGVVGSSGRHAISYAEDYPPFADYPIFFDPRTDPTTPLEETAEQMMKQTGFNRHAFEFLAHQYKQTDDEKYRLLLQSLDGRGDGYPMLSIMRAMDSADKGDWQSAERHYRSAIAAQSTNWGIYQSLGEMLASLGRVKEADNLFRSYPSFAKGAKEHPVEVSNTAMRAGTVFRILGDTATATRYYRLATERPSGSSADYSSRIALKTFAADYAGALNDALMNVQRYNDAAAYRSYLQLLQATGDRETLRKTHDAMSAVFKRGELLLPSTTGHRTQGMSEEQIAEWVLEQATRNGTTGSDFFSNYLLRMGVTDRTPSRGFSERLAGVALPSWKLSVENQTTVFMSPQGGAVLGPRGTEIGGVKQSLLIATGSRTPIKSSLVYFAEAYRAIKTGEYSAAMVQMQEASRLYDLAGESMSSFILPYYAFAAGKAGDSAPVKAYVADFKENEKRFDYLLASAVVAAFEGNSQEAARMLEQARYRLAAMQPGPHSSYYRYAEICYWLYKETGQAAYKEAALKMARIVEDAYPWESWPYAMKAILGNSINDRRRAIAIAIYLDPGSEMLAKIPSKEREIAVREYGNANPFLQRKKP